MRSLARGALLGALVLLCSAHVGSPDAWYEGPAGPYSVLAHIQTPLVIPGIAVVEIKPESPGITRVTAYVNRFDAGASPPPPDVALPMAESPGWLRTRLWVMTSGSNSVTVALEGPRGTGTVVVPLAAVAARRLRFSPALATLLVLLGMALAGGLFTFVGAAVREGVLPPGVEPDAERRRRARIAIGRAVVVVAVALSGWIVWWRVDDRRFTRALFQPLAVRTSVTTGGGSSRLLLTITDSAWVHRHETIPLARGRRPELGELIEDHGKLVHLFLVGAGGGAVFAHLHPVSTDTVSFAATLPPLPAGSYAVFADIVLASGFTETLTARVVLPPGLAAADPSPFLDPDDSWTPGNPAVANRAVLEDGSSLTWLSPAEPPVAGQEAGLRFVLAASQPAVRQLYLGMAGHAAVVRDDDSVFIHLHPLGTISLAAQGRLLRGAGGPPVMSHSSTPGDTLYFPYAFPTAGPYHVWVQLKRGGRVLTGSFPVQVVPAPRRAPAAATRP